MTEALFPIATDEIAITSDDCYTPRWVFDAMGLQFDLDVAAPPGGPWHVPAKRWYTAEDDGLAQPWEGLVWCNPPYSAFANWADKWIAHDRGVLLGYQLPQVRWTRQVFAAADAVAMTGTEFIRPDGKKVRLRQPVFVAFRGVGTDPAERLAAADPYGAVLYGRPQTPSVRVTRDTRTEGSTTHKKEEPAGHPADRRVTLGGAQCACVANAPVAQLPLVSEPAHTGLGQMSRAEGEAARDAVPAPPGRAAGVHGLDLRGPQPQGVAS